MVAKSGAPRWRRDSTRSGRVAAAIAFTFMLGACGGGGGPISTPPPAPAPAPAPTPTPTPTPAAVFDTAEYRRSDGPSFHNVIPAWQLGATGAGVTLAIIDSGIDTTNPEFSGRISAASADVAGSRGLDNGDSSHGTQVALTAAAARNGTGIVGIAYGATIQALRADSPGSCATPKTGDSGGCSFFDSAITAGIDRAINAGAKVINISLGGSPPNQSLRAAIARAASAGIVVVVSAGNDGVSSTTNPDSFAVGLRQAGNGNVIIAGSVDENRQISSFSNHAGTEAQWYLMGMGERVCCVYENGQIKVTTDASGQQFVSVVSGTSFAAPQVAGAVALLRQYFPNLTATQTVDLLLRTASDAGAAGTDDLFGRGIMNIGAAFAPQGATSLADSATTLVLLGETSMSGSPAMGDAGGGSGLSAVVLDSYSRAYKVNLGATMRGAQASPKLGMALLGGSRSVDNAAGPLSMAFSVVDPVRSGQPMGWSGQLRLSSRDAQAARVLAARVIARLSPKGAMGFAYAQGADGMVAQLQGQSRPAFLVSNDTFGDMGFYRTGMTALAYRQQLGGQGLTVLAENGQVLTGSPIKFANSLISPRLTDHFFRVGAALDRRFGPIETSLAASWLREDRTVMGGRLHSSFAGKGGADSLFVDASAAWALNENWRLGAAMRRGWTAAHLDGTLVSGSRLTSSGWAVDASRMNLFQPGDSLSVRLSQPLRVESGGLALRLPVAYDYATLAATSAIQQLSLTPGGRELMRELAWQGQLGGGALTASAFWRTDPMHYASVPDDYGLGLSWSARF
ncbi:MAG: S8 family peptidase [Novosphingobium sp.]